MNPFAFLWRQRGTEDSEIRKIYHEKSLSIIDHREIYRQRLNGATIPCSGYFAINQSSFIEYVGNAPPECDWKTYPEFIKIRIVCKSADGYLHERVFEGSLPDILSKVQESFSLMLADPNKEKGKAEY